MSITMAVYQHWPLFFPRVSFAWWLPCCLILLAFSSSAALAMTIKVAPDRNPVAMNESFNLVFSADEAPDDDPDFSPLEKDFTIVSQGKSSQVSIVNGHFSRKTQWTVTMMANQPGTFTVPAIAFGSDQSETVTLMVLAAAEETDTGSAELLLEVQAEPKNPYVQAQVRYTVRVLRRVNFSGAELSEPVVHDALVERLGEDRSYQAERGGQQYAVIERQYAVFPQKSGSLRIEPLTLEAQIPTGGRSRFNSFFGQDTRVARLQSKAVELNVRPIPAAFTGKHWLPAETLELAESWSRSPPQTAAGEPITRTLNLQAKGATVGVLPELDADLSRVLGDQVKLYPDQPALNEEKQADGIISTRQEKSAMLPAKPGVITLPAIELPWWNTRTDRMEVATLPQRTLTVTGTAEQSGVATAAPQEPAPVAAQTKADGSGPLAAPLEYPDLVANPWFWSSLVGFLGWLATAAAWIASRRAMRSSPSAPGQERMSDLRAANKMLKSACDANDPANARAALLTWAQARWPQRPPEHLAAIAERVGGEFSRQVAELERTLYGRSERPWQGARLWEAVKALLPETEGKPHHRNTTDLEPLYRT